MMIHVLLRMDLGLFGIKTETMPRTLDTAVYSLQGWQSHLPECETTDTVIKPSQGNTF